jgi:hypothetical protein
VLIDNVLWGGSVANVADKDADIQRPLRLRSGQALRGHLPFAGSAKERKKTR